jgi:hypothetical protein
MIAMSHPSFSVKFLLYTFLFFTSYALNAQCVHYIPRPYDLRLDAWPNNQRPASECEVLSARRTNDSLRAAFRNVFTYNRSEWVRVSEPDSAIEIHYLNVFEDVNSKFEPVRKDYFRIKDYLLSQLYNPGLNWHFNYRRNEDLPEFKEINNKRLDQRTRLMQEMGQVKQAGKQTSPLLEAILREICLTDAKFWADNAFAINTYINSSDSPDFILNVSAPGGNAEISTLENGVRLVRIEKSKEFDPQRLLDGNLTPEDLIDDLYFLIGKWEEPLISYADGAAKVNASVILSQPFSMLDVHYIMIKAKGSNLIAQQLIDRINWQPLINLIAP